MKRLSGKPVREALVERLQEEVQLYTSKGLRAPSLAVILVGDNPASETYVKNKRDLCERIGFMHFDYSFCEDTSEAEILALIDELNGRNDVDGILVQLPLPSHISEDAVINRIDPNKDVDGFSPYNVGLLSQGQDSFIPCTPYGIMEMLKFYDIPTVGQRVCVIGRSNIVGKPMAMLMMRKGIDSTVTVCNTKTKDLKSVTLSSDIVIVATGVPETIDSSYIKDGAVVIDVGVNRIPDSTREKGFRLVGDADYESFRDRDVSITPVPGGVGIMTVTMLMANTMKSYRRRMGEL